MVRVKRGDELPVSEPLAAEALASVLRRDVNPLTSSHSAARPWHRHCYLPTEEDTMASIEQSVVVNVPVRMAYNQWTQFEEFPHFMEGVESVQQLDDKRLHWRATIGGKVKEWDAEITEQRPDERIAWTSRSGARNAGVVTFHRLDDQRTKLMLQLDYEPDGAVENVADAIGVVSGRVTADLNRFKEFVESRNRETGSWRGEISHGNVKEPGRTVR
jgi:uncharacterized membrane protein